MIREEARAKVNLFLEVLGRRADGYHEIRTVMLEVPVADRLEVRARRDGVRVACDDPAVPTGPRSPVARAARALLERCGWRRGVEVRIQKRIPIGSGLGGASSDVAAALRALDRLLRAGLPAAELERLAGRVGSDAPFFVRGGAALCWGRGEQVLPLRIGGALWLALVVPDRPNLTAEVYRRVRIPSRPRVADRMLAALAAGDPQAVGAALFNRLEGPAVRNPACRRALQWARRLGAAVVTGSGSAAVAVLTQQAHLPQPPPGLRVWTVAVHGD